MPHSKKILVTDLSLADLKRLIAQKEQVEPLQAKKAKLEEELKAVVAQLKKLGAADMPKAKRGRKPGRQPGRKPGRKPSRKPGRPATKKVARKVAKKAGRRVGKKAKGQITKKAAPKKPAPKTPPIPSIQDVVVALIREHGKPMPFQTIMANIKHRRLVKTKAKDFENVLRRTLSTSKRVKRVGRGVYGVKGKT